MATKLYLHRTEFSVNGLTAEQSSLAPDANLFDNEDGSENRTMNKTISAVAQTSMTNTQTGDTNAHNYYVARWVSPVLAQTSVAANTWTLEFAASEANANANFPRSGAGALRVCAYVWKPSNGTKYGNILDGNTNADGEEAGTSQTVINCTFSGSAVNSLTSGDAVIVIEIWAIVTQGTATARAVTVFYDGTTENSTSNMAARLETPENLAFQYPATVSQSFTTSDSLAKVATKFRSMSDTITTSDAISKIILRVRAISQTISVTDSLSKVALLIRSASQSITTSDAIQRIKTANRVINQSISVVDAIERVLIAGGTLFERGINETISVTDSLVRLAMKNRAISETISVVDAIARIATKNRVINQTVSVVDALTRSVLKLRSISQSISLSDAVVRLFIGGGGQLFERAINETISLSPAISRIATKLRSINQSISVTDALQKTALHFISIAQTISLSDALTRVKLGFGELFHVEITETINLSASVNLIKKKFIGIGQYVANRGRWNKFYNKSKKKWSLASYRRYLKKETKKWKYKKKWSV